MRIGLVSQEYPPETSHGGIGSQTYLKAHGLASYGHEVHVISHSPDTSTHHYDDGPVRVTRIPGFDSDISINTDVVRWLTYSLRVAVAVAELHRETPLDIVDFPDWGCEGYIHLLNRAEWYSIPTAIQLHGPLVMLAHTIGWPSLDSEFYRVGTAMEATCLRLADAVFSSSQCSADWCARDYGLDTSEIPILHTGVDTTLFRPIKAPKNDRPTIIFVGKIVSSKGVHHLLEATIRLRQQHPGLNLRMIGPGEAKVKNALRRQASQSGYGDLLHLEGFVQKEDLPSILSQADVFAAPSLYEGGPGFVYLEAMACGLPVVASEGSGASEVVTHEVNGLLVAPADTDALMAALNRLLADPTERAAMGQRGRRYAETEADSRVCIGRIEAFYRNVAGRGSQPDASYG